MPQVFVVIVVIAVIIAKILHCVNPCKYHMRILYTVLTLAPAPLFFLGFIYSIITPSQICGVDYSMSVMWLVMCLAHCTPWILRCQQLYLTRN